MFIYSLKIIVDCEWDEWQVGECDKSCGGGLLTKTRVPKVDKAHGGKECTGPSSVTESCNVQECPGKFNVTFTLVKGIINYAFRDKARAYYFNLQFDGSSYCLHILFSPL